MSKAYVNGVLSSFTLIPSEKVSLDINKIREMYGEIPSVSWSSSLQQRTQAAQRLQETVDRLVSLQKELAHTLDGRAKTKISLHDEYERGKPMHQHVANAFPVSQKALLKKGKVKYALSPDGLSKIPVTVGVDLVYSEGEKGLQDYLSIRQDWLNVSNDVYAAYVAGVECNSDG